MHPHLPWGTGGVKNFRKIFLEKEVSNLNFDEGGGAYIVGRRGGSSNFEVKMKTA